MSVIFPSWLTIDRSVLTVDDPTMVNTSGGRTSALMALMYHRFGSGGFEFCFWNTGREHPGTYTFLRRLSDEIPLRYFEVRKPATFGAGPSEMQFEEVSFGRLDQSGKPFEIFLETIAEYRKHQKGAEAIGPNPVQRLCTAYMKAKLSDHVAASWGWESYTQAIGLRADEPARVAKLSARETRNKSLRAPLADLGITKCMVENFFAEQDFDLDIPAHQGNCTLCFLKDEADLADILLHETDPDGKNWQWWKDLDAKFNMLGRGSPSYVQIETEAPTRFDIRSSLNEIRPLPNRPDWMEPRRFKLLLRQEQKILRDGIKRVPCSCEASELMTDTFVADLQGCLF